MFFGILFDLLLIIFVSEVPPARHLDLRFKTHHCFIFSYVSAMVPVKSVKEHDCQLDVAVLFSESLDRFFPNRFEWLFKDGYKLLEITFARVLLDLYC